MQISFNICSRKYYSIEFKFSYLCTAKISQFIRFPFASNDTKIHFNLFNLFHYQHFHNLHNFNEIVLEKLSVNICTCLCWSEQFSNECNQISWPYNRSGNDKWRTLSLFGHRTHRKFQVSDIEFTFKFTSAPFLVINFSLLLYLRLTNFLLIFILFSMNH